MTWKASTTVFPPALVRCRPSRTSLLTAASALYLADYSVAGPPRARCEFVFDRKHMGANDSDIHMTLASWKDRYLPGYRADLLLRMDIEGAEYEVILGTPNEVLSSFGCW